MTDTAKSILAVGIGLVLIAGIGVLTLADIARELKRFNDREEKDRDRS